MDNKKDHSKRIPNTNKEEYEVGGNLDFDDDPPMSRGAAVLTIIVAIVGCLFFLLWGIGFLFRIFAYG